MEPAVAEELRHNQFNLLQHMNHNSSHVILSVAFVFIESSPRGKLWDNNKQLKKIL